MTSSGANLQSLLKAASVAFHRRLHEHPLLLGLIRPSLTTVNYVRTLEVLHRAYAPIEATIAGFAGGSASPLPFALIERAALIERDLAFHGVRQWPAAQTSPPVIDTLPRLLGMLYVIEGASLGGQVIARHIAASIGAVPGAGADFFNFGNGDATSRWKSFWTVSAKVCRPIDVEEAVDACRAGFSFFHRVFSDTPDHGRLQSVRA